jgi:hypothetical protein
MTKAFEIRNVQLDLFKGFSILAIIFWHFHIIPTWLFIWAIPTFVFTTSSLFQEKWKNISPKRIIVNLGWIFGIVFFFTLLARFLNISSENNSNLFSISIIKYFILRNPYLGNLWYFLLYFQILAGFCILSIFYKKFHKKFHSISKWKTGVYVFILSEIISYLILYIFGEGISFNFLSWGFLIWLGLFHYDNIRFFFQKLQTKYLLFLILSNSLLIFFILKIGSESIYLFLQSHLHDFIFPTFILQLNYILILFCITEFLVRYFSQKTLFPLIIAGKYSLYIYMFHVFFHRVIFLSIPENISIILVLISCLFAGKVLESLRTFVYTFVYVKK